MITLLLFIDFMMTVVPFIATGIYYNSMPDKIPVFVNLLNEPLLLADKNIFTAFRLPLMALILQAICLVMYMSCRKNSADNRKTSVLMRSFWMATSITAAVKFSFSWLPFTGVVPYFIIPMFRIMTVAAALLGVIYMLVTLLRLFKEDGSGMAKLFVPAGRTYIVLIAVLFAVYAVVVFLPGVLYKT